MNLTPTIIAIAEARHYLVGLRDSDNNLRPFPDTSQIVSCLSLNEAKLVLKERNYTEACLVQQTAYDEMCGLQGPSHAETHIKLF